MDEATECLKPISVKKYNSDPTHLSFKNITSKVTCKRKKRDKYLLRDVSGSFKPGRLTAILGPSGAGKTTLVNILAGYKTKEVTGHILINGKDRSYDDKWKSCCISQDPALLPYLTTRETLSVAADLKMPSNTSTEKKEKVINEIGDLLNLQKSMDTRVEKLSGGEIKRLSIGVELVTNPPIMFFDEPTSGLDSVSSVQVISHLKELALEGRTIICVIHQPSSKIFDMFDDMILVSEGKIIYGGSVKEMVSTFQSAGFTCPQYYNRADFAIEVASLELDGNIDTLAAKSKMSDSDSGLSNTLDDMGSSDKGDKDTYDGNKNIEYIDDGFNQEEAVYIPVYEDTVVAHRSDYAVPQWRQFIILLKRSLKCTFRDLQLAYMRVSAHIMVAISLGLVYYQIGDDAAKIQSNASFLFFLLLFIFFANSMPTVLTFPQEAAVFQRESLNHWYSLPAYYFSKILADFPLQLFCPTIFMLISYHMTGQPCDYWRVLMVWFICVVFTIISQASGLIAGVALDPQMALFALPASTIPMLILSGFFIRFNELPRYLSGLSYVSYFGYGFEAIAQAVYSFDRPKLQCSEDFCYFIDPKKFMKDLSARLSYKYDVILLLGVMVFLYCLLYIVLVIRIWKSRQ